MERQVGAAADDVVALLSTRPATWLGTFLKLATNTVGAVPPVDRLPQWFRLGDAVGEGEGGCRARLTWFPRSPGLFDAFHGELAVSVRCDRTFLVVDGQIDRSGDVVEDADRAVLDGLVALLAGALSVSDRGSR